MLSGGEQLSAIVSKISVLGALRRRYTEWSLLEAAFRHLDSAPRNWLWVLAVL
jgi:hypothetical protein